MLPASLPTLTACRDDKERQLMFLKPNVSVPIMARNTKRLDLCSVRNNPLLENNPQFQKMVAEFSKVLMMHLASNKNYFFYIFFFLK